MEAYYSIPGAPTPIGPYCAAVRSGTGLLFCSGQIGIDPKTGTVVEGGVESQTKQVLENLKAVLEGAGSGWHRVLMTTIFLTDIADGKVVNPLYAGYVSPDSPPARQTVAVKGLPMGVLVEISVIAE